MLNIQRENSLALLQDASAWDALSAGNPLRQATWLRCWWEAFAPKLGEGSEAYLISARQTDGTLVAAMPLYRHHAHGRSVLSAIGQGDACTDHVSVLVHPQQDASSVGAEIGRWLAAAAKSPADYWDLLDIDGLIEGDQAVKGFATALQEARATLQAVSRMSLWFKPTENETWDQYLAGLSKSHRRKTRRRSTRVAEDPTLSWQWPESREDVLRALAELIDMHQRRWQALGQPGSYATAEMRCFVNMLVERLHARHQVRIPLLLRNGQPIAAEFQILGDDRVLYSYSSALDPEHQDVEPGHVINVASLQFAYEQKLAGMDLMRGDEPYKERLGAEGRRVVRLHALAPSRAPRLKQAAWGAAFGAKQWMRTQLGCDAQTSVDLTV